MSQTLFFKSNLLHIRTNEGEFEVSNPESIGFFESGNFFLKSDEWGTGFLTDPIEWPYGVELIKQRGAINLTVARLIPEEKKEFKPAQPTPNFPIGGMSFTESAYKEFEGNCSKCGHPLNPATAGYQCTNINCPAVESSEPQEKEWQATPAKKKPLSERLEDISRKIRERKATKIEEIELFEAYKLGKHENVSAPSESQEELWKEVVDAFYYCNTNEQYLLAEQAIKKKFTITRKPE